MALKVLKQVMEEKLDENNVQLAQVSMLLCWTSLHADLQVTKEKGFQIISEADLKALIEGLPA